MLNGRVLIDATNPFIQYSPRLVLADLAAWPGMAPARAARPALSCGPLVTGAPYQAASVTPWW